MHGGTCCDRFCRVGQDSMKNFRKPVCNPRGLFIAARDSVLYPCHYVDFLPPSASISTASLTGAGKKIPRSVFSSVLAS